MNVLSMVFHNKPNTSRALMNPRRKCRELHCRRGHHKAGVGPRRPDYYRNYMIHDDLGASNILIPRTQRRDSSISDKGTLDRH